MKFLYCTARSRMGISEYIHLAWWCCESGLPFRWRRTNPASTLGWPPSTWDIWVVLHRTKHGKHQHLRNELTYINAFNLISQQLFMVRNFDHISWNYTFLVGENKNFHECCVVELFFLFRVWKPHENSQNKNVNHDAFIKHVAGNPFGLFHESMLEIWPIWRFK